MPTIGVINKISEEGNEEYCPIKSILSHARLGIDYEECKGCKGNKYCANKKTLLGTKMSDKTVLQLTCMEKLRLKESQEKRHEIGANEVGVEWTDENDSGFAPSREFAKLYAEGNRDPKVLLAKSIHAA